MQATLIKEVDKLSRPEKLELAHYLLDALAVEDDAELSPAQQAELESRWQEIEADRAELYTGSQLSDELKEKYGWNISLP
ncbi:MAG TPA: addiction module protein [Saprospiraceae bacterium]|nr:addiction module protein [Saprospiraceae bacterium]HMP13640.1 addiction module protein [Saprospiraceae bacterium]